MDPLVIFVSAVRYTLVVVTKYRDGTHNPSPWLALAIQRFAFCEPVPVMTWFPVARIKAETLAPVATVSAARRLYLYTLNDHATTKSFTYILRLVGVAVSLSREHPADTRFVCTAASLSQYIAF